MKKYLSSYWIRSALFTFLQRFSLTFFGFGNFLILVRTLSKPQMGVWAFFLIVTSFFEMSKSSLLKNAHIKFVGSNNEEKTRIASSSIIINSGLTLLFIFLLLTFSGELSTLLGATGELEVMLRWFIPGMVGLIFFSHLEAVSQSHLDFRSVFAGYFTRQLIFFVLIAFHAVFKISFSLIDVVIYQSISIVIGTVIIFFYSKKHLLYVFNPSFTWVKKLLGFGGYVFGIGLTSNIFANIDQLMIAKFTGSKSMVATYNTASRITGIVDIPSYSAAEIMLPKVSQVSLSDGSDKIKYMYEKMVGILLCFTTPIALFILIFPGFVISIVAGPEYADATFILQMYMLSAIIRPVQNQAANILLYIGKARLCFILNIVFLFINFGLNYICFIQFGPYGAAIGNVISSFLGTIVWYSVLKKLLDLRYGQIGVHVASTYAIIYSKFMSVLKFKQQA